MEILTPGFIAALALAALIGVSLGALGSGGSIVTLPVLVYVAGVPVHAAVGMSLAIVGGTSLVGAWLHFRQGQFHGKAVLLFGLAGGAAAWFGSGLTHRVSPPVLMLIFAGLMLVVSAMMLRSSRETQPGAKCRLARCLAAGAVVGVLTGFLGVGGGFLIVPALVLLAGLETRVAVGSSLAIIALNCFSGFLGHLDYRALEMKPTLAFLAVASLGLVLGLKLAGRLSDRSLRKAFAFAVLAMAVVIGAVNLQRLI